MKKSSLIIILLSFLTLGSLVIWQIMHLRESYKLKAELDKSEMQNSLMESAIEIRKIESDDSTYRNSTNKLKRLTDSVLKKNFANFNYKIKWAYFNGIQEALKELNNIEDSIQLTPSNFNVCTSCLLSISFTKNKETLTQGDIKESGYVIDHTPAQMREIMGMDVSKLKYLHIFPSAQKVDLSIYVIPFVFLIGLSSLLIWLLYLNHKQSKLIIQKNEFVNHLSHQFQTPLSSIKLSANLLAKQSLDESNELISIIQTESKRLENHIKTVLHWVKSDADRLRINKKTTNLTDVVERSLNQMKPVFITNKTKINFIPPKENLKVNADENHLQLMLFNIWENAIKHNETAIELTITCFNSATEISIKTSDNGMGLHHEMAPEKFKGLGLAYIRKIMKEHSGSVDLKSVKHKGLSLQLNFPISDD